MSTVIAKPATDIPPPEDPEAEKALIGCIILNANEVLPGVMRMVKARDMTRWQSRAVYESIASLRMRDADIDVRSIASECAIVAARGAPAVDPWKQVAGGVMGYIVECMQAVPTYLHYETYAQRVAHVSALRRVIRMANEMAGDAYAQFGTDASEAIARALKSVSSLMEDHDWGKVVTSEQLTKDYYGTLTDRMDKREEVVGYATGLADLDRYISLRRDEIIYVGALTSVGKTAFLLTLFDYLTGRGIPCLFASIEQPLAQLMDRAVAGMTRIESTKISRGNLTDSEQAAVGRALEALAKRPGYFVEDGSLNTVALDAHVQVAAARGVKVVFVDYIQKLTDRHGHSKAEEIGYISNQLTRIAKRHHVTVVAASQLNKAGELRWAAELEHDAFVILKLERAKNAAEAKVTIEKNRNGWPGMVIPLYFERTTTQFMSADRSEPAGARETVEAAPIAAPAPPASLFSEEEEHDIPF